MDDRIMEKTHNSGLSELAAGNVPLLGEYKSDYPFKKESLQFFRSCVGEDVYEKVMRSEVGRSHPYAVARAFLAQADWEKFVWIEQYGSLDGFPVRDI